jgi:uncharacterized protein YcfJ
MVRFNKLTLATVGILALVLAGCSGTPITTREKGVLAGGILGAGTGAIIGSAVGAPGPGAAIGGGLGALTGGIIGNELQNREVVEAQTQSQVSYQQREIEQQRRHIQSLEAERETSYHTTYHRSHRRHHRRTTHSTVTE